MIAKPIYQKAERAWGKIIYIIFKHELKIKIFCKFYPKTI